jgi:hypothetical protein
MKKQIVQVSVLQSAKVAAVLYLVITVPLAAILLIPTMLMGSAGFGVPTGALIAMPVLYALCGFVFTVIGAWIYNFVASLVGGFEFTTAEVNPR